MRSTFGSFINRFSKFHLNSAIVGISQFQTIKLSFESVLWSHCDPKGLTSRTLLHHAQSFRVSFPTKTMSKNCLKINISSSASSLRTAFPLVALFIHRQECHKNLFFVYDFPAFMHHLNPCLSPYKVAPIVFRFQPLDFYSIK